MEFSDLAEEFCEQSTQKQQGEIKDIHSIEESRKQFWALQRKKHREHLKEKRHNVPYEDIVKSNNAKFRWKNTSIDQIQFHLPRICLDASFEAQLSEKEINSVGSQIMHAYGFFKRCEHPLYFHLTSYGGKLEERMQDFDGINDWKVFFDRRPFYEVFNIPNIIYLSPESEEVLEELHEDKVYIIGAIADHNRLKGLSAKHARDLGVRSARLPVDQFLQDVPNVSLNINHVFEILVKYAACKDWQRAFNDSVPTRTAYQKKKIPDASDSN